MSRIFITGAADGLGQMAAKLLIADGHQVVLHARSEHRAKEALASSPGAEASVAGDLSDIKETIALAEKVNKLGRFDAIITMPVWATRKYAVAIRQMDYHRYSR
jgi:NAD(P)-dependent dehydrogenase (short-subunit alcohol dehydrogenase family)